jgi:hypothetical protein
VSPVNAGSTRHLAVSIANTLVDRYIIRQYGQKRDELSDAFRLSLILQRVQGQLPIEELRRVPCPSEMDDWELYERFEGELVKQRCGNPRFVEWKMAKAQERMEKEQFERILQFECQTYTERGAEGE